MGPNYHLKIQLKTALPIIVKRDQPIRSIAATLKTEFTVQECPTIM